MRDDPGKRWPRQPLMGKALMAASAALMMVAGCGPGFNELSGEDKSRAGAGEVPLNRASWDRVSADHGDNTDWKTFLIEEDGAVSVRVWWDDPEVEGLIVVRDAQARSRGEIEKAPKKKMDEIGPLGLPAGQYYVHVELTSGASVYTLEVLTAAKGGSGGSRPDF